MWWCNDSLGEVQTERRHAQERSIGLEADARPEQDEHVATVEYGGVDVAAVARLRRRCRQASRRSPSQSLRNEASATTALVTGI